MKIQTKIQLMTLVLLAMLAVSLSVVFSLLMNSVIDDEFRKRGASVVSELASNGRMGVLMQDSSQLAPLVESVLSTADVRYVAFLDAGQAKLIERGRSAGLAVDGERFGDVTWATLADGQGNDRAQFQMPVYSRGGGSPIGMARVEISYESVNATRTSAMLWSVFISSAFLLLALGATMMLGRVLQPLKDLAEKAELIASGDLTVDIVSTSGDEVGQLASSFMRMVERLRGTIGRLVEASAAVASASAEISASTEEMAAGAREQTSQVTAVAASVEHLSRTTADNSRGAVGTSETARAARASADEGGKVVEQSVQSMKRIAHVVQASAETVRALGKSSAQIGQIVSVIDDIADQTNLLALNAAIEAARAGEQGRGFAVVADEVRKLAERTTTATKEIADMIQKIQTDTGEAVRSMEQGTVEVDNGIKLADAAGSSLRGIVSMSQTVTEMVAQIASASELQASASEQISKSVDGISSVARETATGIQQIARTAEDLNRLTENLQELIGQFRLKGEAPAAERVSPVLAATHRPIRRVDSRYELELPHA
ncbi:MAG: methyl-accepting chemotaxis protein [Bacteroidetes bacterium]|jgi:methyl-accepting chemotaxis protein|nr:methyl-accepting chemotaxis protein [Bacteroidota bacterium]